MERFVFRCLGYQACVFNFGNEFCQKDPFPGARKILNANITCVKDHLDTQVNFETFVYLKSCKKNTRHDCKKDEYFATHQ